MRAAVVRSFGPAQNVLFETNYLLPVLEGKGKVLVRVKAAGVNPVDTYIRSGNYAALPRLPYVPGREGAGIVEKVGSSEEESHNPHQNVLKPGQRVWFTMPLTGSCAEYSLTSSELVYPLPDNISFNEGATLGIAYLTAYRALFMKARPQSGQSLFIHGVSGGVGLAIAQLARAHGGLSVYGSASSTQGREVAEENGVLAVYNHADGNYIKEIAEAHPQGFDIIIEMLANKNLVNDLAMLSKQGKIVIVGNRGSIEQFDPRAIMQKEATVMGVMQAASTNEEYAAMAKHLNELLASGLIRPPIGKTYPLEKVADAHVDVMENKVTNGKLVITIDD